MIDKLKALLGLGIKPEPLDTELIFVVIPDQIAPLERSDKYEAPLDAELKLAGLGVVSGGGTLMSAPDQNGNCSIEWCGVDVDTTDVKCGRELLRTHLPQLGCPAGTELEYNVDGLPYIDRYDGQNWLLDRQLYT